MGAVLAASRLGYRDVVQIRTFVVDHDEVNLETLLVCLHEVWGEEPPAQTLVGVAALALPDMLFEVDAIATGS